MIFAISTKISERVKERVKKSRGSHRDLEKFLSEFPRSGVLSVFRALEVLRVLRVLRDLKGLRVFRALRVLKTFLKTSSMSRGSHRGLERFLSEFLKSGVLSVLRALGVLRDLNLRVFRALRALKTFLKTSSMLTFVTTTTASADAICGSPHILSF
jgi:hypothetical protein